MLDLCLISAATRRSRESQNRPISRHFFSGASRDRTGDLLLAKQALSQLSYGPAAPQYTCYKAIPRVGGLAAVASSKASTPVLLPNAAHSSRLYARCTLAGVDLWEAFERAAITALERESQKVPVDRMALGNGLQLLAIAKSKDPHAPVPPLGILTDDELTNLVKALLAGYQVGA
jgi:hypothetical protein